VLVVGRHFQAGAKSLHKKRILSAFAKLKLEQEQEVLRSVATAAAAPLAPEANGSNATDPPMAEAYEEMD
jgi:hypothetical protein